MSYTTLFKVPERGEIEVYAEYKNSWLSAMYVWESLRKRYLPHLEFLRDYDPVWKLHKDIRLPIEYRIVLATTFDHAMVKRSDLNVVADAMDKFSKDFGDYSHLPAMAADLRKLFNDQECFAVCWNQTSVAADLWWVWDNPEGDSRGYDVSRDSGHWFIFQDILIESENC